MLIPNLILGLFNLLLLNKQKASFYFKKIFVFPFEIFNDFLSWFFQAKFTAYISITLVITFLIQIIFLNSNEQLINSLMTNSAHIFHGNFHSTLTSIFLHGNLGHLFSNLLALNIFGRIVEQIFKEKIIYLFIASGIIANLISNLISYLNNDIFYSLGASGGIAGLIIMAILLNPLQFTSLLIIPLPIFLIGWSLIVLDIVGLSNPSQTNNLAHIGGYLALIILMFFIELRQRKKIYLGLSINLAFFVLIYLINKYFGLSIINFLL